MYTVKDQHTSGRKLHALYDGSVQHRPVQTPEIPVIPGTFAQFKTTVSGRNLRIRNDDIRLRGTPDRNNGLPKALKCIGINLCTIRNLYVRL